MLLARRYPNAACWVVQTIMQMCCSVFSSCRDLLKFWLRADRGIKRWQDSWCGAEVIFCRCWLILGVLEGTVWDRSSHEASGEGFLEQASTQAIDLCSERQSWIPILKTNYMAACRWQQYAISTQFLSHLPCCKWCWNEQTRMFLEVALSIHLQVCTVSSLLD